MGLFTKNYPPEIAARIPPGQRLVKSWPVLQYGPVPDVRRNELGPGGLRARRPSVHAHLSGAAGAPHVTVDADMHCVTGWTTLDNTWEGVSFRTLMEMAGPQPEAKWVIAHCAHGYTSDLSLQAMRGRRRAAGVAQLRRGPDARARLAAAAGRPQALRLEEREVAHGPRVQRRRTRAGSGRSAATTSTASPSRRSATATRRAAAPSWSPEPRSRGPVPQAGRA